MLAVLLIEIAGRLVGQQYFRLVRKGARDGHALLFAARKLRGVMMRPVAQADFVDQRPRTDGGLGDAHDLHRREDVFVGRERGNQMERLKAYLSGLPKISAGHTLSEHERLSLEAFTMLKLADKDALAQPDKFSGRYKKLDEFLGKMNMLLHAVSNAVSKTYFKHAQTQQQLFRSGNL